MNTGMEKKKFRFWAIGFKGWVEVRRAVEQPKKVVTEAVRRFKTRLPGHGNEWVPQQTKIVSVVFEGGKVVGVYRAEAFRRAMGVAVDSDVMREIPRDLWERRRGSINEA